MAYENPEQQNFELDSLLSETNLVSKLSEEQRKELSELVVKGYETDLASRREWEEQYDVWLKLAMQVKEKKSFPWPGASNVKFPLLSTASMQFAARAYPALIPAQGNVVAYRVIGADPEGQKAARAQEVGKYMSWQLLEGMDGWEEDEDRMLIMLPIVGTAFKKTFYSAKRGKKCSKLVHAKDLVVNYWTKDLASCERKTEKLFYSKRELIEKFRSGEFNEVEFSDPKTENLKTENKLSGLASGEVDETTPYLVLEQHRYYDLDGDGYEEPYVVYVLNQDEKPILRMIARWDSDGVQRDEANKVMCISPVEYYTKFPFIPNPDGGFYDVGFGLLLGSLNDSANTLINQLIDSGTLNNLGGGWMSKGLRIKQGTQEFKLGEYKQVDATMDDLRKGIFPRPMTPPSDVLFQLLGMIINSTKELASVAEIFTGKMPGQNTPAYTTKETVEQGMKVFTAIYKRIYRAFAEELRKLYRLNRVYPKPEEVQAVTDSQMAAVLFTGPSDDVVPAADPQAISMTDKVAKARSLLELTQLGLDRMAVVKRVLEAMEIPNPQELMPKGPPPPSPEMQKIQAEMQMQKEEHDLTMKEMEMKFSMLEKELNAKLQFELAKIKVEEQKLGIKVQEAQIDQQTQLAQAAVDRQTGQQQMVMNEQQHQQKLQQGAAAHTQKIQQTKEAAKAEPEVAEPKEPKPKR